MDTREALKHRPDIAREDVDDIIGIAQELQEAERAEAEGASVAEVEAVARELEIDPRYIEQAIERLHTRRRREAEEASARSAATRRMLLIGGGGLLSALTVGGLGALARSAARSRAEREADAVLAQAQASLQVVLQRQASLAPQLVALAGGDGEGLDALAAAVGEGSVEERLAASDALARELATRLGALPPASDPATAQQRLDLQYELTGAQNRITVERRRYEEARLAREQAWMRAGCG